VFVYGGRGGDISVSYSFEFRISKLETETRLTEEGFGLLSSIPTYKFHDSPVIILSHSLRLPG